MNLFTRDGGDRVTPAVKHLDMDKFRQYQKR